MSVVSSVVSYVTSTSTATITSCDALLVMLAACAARLQCLSTGAYMQLSAQTSDDKNESVTI